MSNENCIKQMQDFVRKEETALVSFLMVTLDSKESDKFKLEVLKDRVEKYRKDLHKFDLSLDWQDE